MLNVLLIANECGDSGMIAATISKKELVDFIEEKGYEAVEEAFAADANKITFQWT